jgi:UDP-2,3-diacylglucosamine hydrolase
MASKIYFASDFHLGVPDKESSLEREKAVVRWLDMVAQDAEQIFLLGDVFDYWWEFKHVVPRGYTRLMGKLAELTDNGLPIHFFIGNHDIWTFGYLEEELGMKVYRKPVQIELQGKKMYIGHGDGLGPGEWDYKIMKAVFHHRLSHWIWSRFHPNFSVGLGQYFSRRSRMAHSEGDQAFHGDNEYLTQFAKSVLEKDYFDYFVFGHRHLPLEIELGGGSKYINLGEWVNERSFGVMEGGILKLDSFKGK